MENALVRLLLCECFLLTKASDNELRAFSCNGCSSNGDSDKYRCGNCILLKPEDIGTNPNICANCLSNCPLFPKCNNDVTQKTVTEPTTTNTNVQGQEAALKVTEKQTNKDCSSGTIAGSTIGGVLFGSLVTIFVIMFHYKKKQIRNPVSKALQTPAYQAEIMCVNEKSGEEDNTKGMYSEINDQKSIKVSQVAPIRRNGDAPGTNDGVYNHLHETNRVDKNEYYDHPRPGASVSTPSDGYGTVTVDYDHARPVASVSTPADGYGTVTMNHGVNDKHPETDMSMVDYDKLSEKTKADEYFVLEKIQ